MGLGVHYFQTHPIGGYHFGVEIPFDVKIAFRHEGVLEGERMSLYNVRWAGQKMGDAWEVNLDPKFPPMFHKPVDISDFKCAHDVCCGLGGFSSALDFVGSRAISGFDLPPLAISGFSLNHSVPTFCEDIGSSSLVFKLHGLQSAQKCQPMLTAGFPCQPFSPQGQQLRSLDARSDTLRSLLRCAFWLQSSGLLLECVAEAQHDESTQKAKCCQCGDLFSL